jgi:hypothetical protein
MALSTPPALDMCILNDEMEPTSIDKLRAGGVLVVGKRNYPMMPAIIACFDMGNVFKSLGRCT